jgi:hypothetical protein
VKLKRRKGNGWGNGKRVTQRPRVDTTLIERIDRIVASIGHSRDAVIGMLLADALARIEAGLPDAPSRCGLAGSGE